jgi:hypothetical protein
MNIQEFTRRLAVACQYGCKLPIVEETNYTGSIAIGSNCKWNDPASMKKELNRVGFDLIEGSRRIEVLVLTRKSE